MNARNFGKASAHIERARQILQFGGGYTPRRVQRVAVEPIMHLKETVDHGPPWVTTEFGGVDIVLTAFSPTTLLITPTRSDLMEFTARVRSIEEVDDGFLQFAEQWLDGERLTAHSMIKFLFTTHQLQQQQPQKLDSIWVEGDNGSISRIQRTSFLIDALGWQTLKSYAAHMGGQ